MDLSILIELVRFRYDHPQIEYLQMFEKHDDGTYLRAPWKTPWGFPSLDPIE